MALIEAFGGELGARVEWIRSGEAQVLLALSEGRIDLAIGGLTESNPWSDDVAFTRPYHQSSLSITTRPAADGIHLVTVPQQKLNGQLEQVPLLSQNFGHVMDGASGSGGERPAGMSPALS